MPRRGLHFLILVSSTILLYLSSTYSYLLFHSLIEIFSIVIGFSVFILAWNSRQRLENHFLLFLGISFLFVSGVDLVHTLAYNGMNVFPGYDANLPTQLWVAARYMQGLSMLASFIFLKRELNSTLVFTMYSLLTAVLLAAIFSGYFPDCFIEGSGLTMFKKISEYLISFFLLVSIGFLIRNRAAFDRVVMRSLIVYLAFTIGAELAFTFYVSVYGLSNLVGHLLKLGATIFIYFPIVETGLEKPQRLLFRQLQQNEDALQAALRESELLAITDPLTGIYNRRHFYTVAESELTRSIRYHRPLSIIMLDIDRFKTVNDTYGHSVGDQVLVALTKRIEQTLRASDIFARHGGEEFVILLPETGTGDAIRAAERLRSEASKPIVASGHEISVNISLGVATHSGHETVTIDDLLGRADQAMYEAKQAGRNRAIAWAPQAS